MERLKVTLLSIVIVFSISDIFGQSTGFTFQGTISSSGGAANGNFDFEFALFDAVSGGTQLGTTQSVNSVAVSSGLFSVMLDFGNQFPGSNRFLEIRVRQAGGGAYTTLSPRQSINSAPYAVKSLSAVDAESVGGLPASSLITTSDPRLTNARPPTAGSGNYVQNTTSQQPSSNFYITGTGRANEFNAASHFSILGQRILSVPGESIYLGRGTGQNGVQNVLIGDQSGGSNLSSADYNVFVGGRAGFSNTSGSRNVFIGAFAGLSNQTGYHNSIVGHAAGQSNTTGQENSFFGNGSGFNNIVGSENSFFGSASGGANTSGSGNAFFGFRAGRFNVTGGGNSFFGVNSGEENEASNNSFFGYNAGLNNVDGSSNVFVGLDAGFNNSSGNDNVFAGRGAGYSNTSGSANTLLGFGANVSIGQLTNASAIGFRSFVSLSNSLILGSINGVNSATSDTNVGIGTTAPSQRLHVVGNTALVGNVGIGNTSPAYRLDVTGRIRLRQPEGGADTSGIFLARNDGQGNPIDTAFVGMRDNTSVGFYSGQLVTWPLHVNTETGITSISALGPAGVDHLCRNVSGQIASCSSSIQYKKDITDFDSGLGLLKKLRPVSFNWKDDGMADIGLVAEEVAGVEPLLTTKNKDGKIEGVKYDRIGVIAINAINEQQEQIESQNKKIEGLTKENALLRSMLEQIKTSVCRQDSAQLFCKETNK